MELLESSVEGCDVGAGLRLEKMLLGATSALGPAYPPPSTCAPISLLGSVRLRQVLSTKSLAFCYKYGERAGIHTLIAQFGMEGLKDERPPTRWVTSILFMSRP